MKFVLRESESEKDKLEFYLDEEDGEIILCFKEPSGAAWDVCTLKKDGILRLESNLPGDIGLDVDNEGEINIDCND